MSSSLRRPPLTPVAYSLARDHGPLDPQVQPVPMPRRRGRPPLATPDEVQRQIRDAAAEGRLFRVHLDQPALYARARRLWGSWAAALHAAGVDYDATMAVARRRALETRRRTAGQPPRAAC